jgi:hypothetical protein
VLERAGDAIRFNPELLRLASHYRFEPRPVAVARGNEKGRVERDPLHPRQLLRRARVHRSADLNAQARAWCLGLAAERRWPEDSRLSVRQAFEAEGRSLLALPERPSPWASAWPSKVGKTPYVRFDTNDYSVPHTHVRRTLTVLADEQWVRVLDGSHRTGRHRRCWDSHVQIETRPMCSAWSMSSARRGPTAPATAWRRPRRPAPSCCSVPARAARTWARSPRP